MMTGRSLRSVSRWADQTPPPAIAGTFMAVFAAYPAPLLPLARAYQELCAQYPPLAIVTFHAPALPVVFLLVLAAVSLLVGAWAGLSGLVRTHRFNRWLRDAALPLPESTARAAAALGIPHQVTVVAWDTPAACCYGLLQPRIAISARLLDRLDEEELLAVLAHERQHLRRRDPLRYLLLHALTAAAFILPVAPALRQRHEARIELDADRAALEVVPRGALAGALLAVVGTSAPSRPGTAWLTATEARIAHLSGRSVTAPNIPVRLIIASAVITVIAVLTTVSLAAREHLPEVMCVLCQGRV